MKYLTVIMAALTASAAYLPTVHGIPLAAIIGAFVTAVAHVLPSPLGFPK